jgi:hypothetical protein
MVSRKCQFNFYRHIPQNQYLVIAIAIISCTELHDWSYLWCHVILVQCSFHLDLVPYISHILHTALPYIGFYRSTQAAWPPARCSNGCFDILNLTESVDMLESPGLVVTVLAASVWDLVNSWKIKHIVKGKWRSARRYCIYKYTATCRN